MAFDPKLVEARISLGLLTSTEMPAMACDALEAGFDGPALRQLAGLVCPSYFDVRDFVPIAVQEMGITTSSRGDAALLLAGWVARGVAESRLDPFTSLQRVEEFWRECDYCRQLAAFGNLAHDVELAFAVGEPSESIRQWLLER